MKEKGNILKLYAGDIRSKLPQIFYNCEVVLPKNKIHIIDKLFLFRSSRFYRLYKPSSMFPVGHKMGFKDISGYFYDSRFSNLDYIGNFNIKGIDGKSNFIINGVSVKRNSSDSIHSYHSFFALSFEYIKS